MTERERDRCCCSDFVAMGGIEGELRRLQQQGGGGGRLVATFYLKALLAVMHPPWR